MARRKGISKSKFTSRKTTKDNSESIPGNESLNDDPGGGNSFQTKIMKPEIQVSADKQISIQQNMNENYQTLEQNTSLLNNNITNSSDLKYLHKKFKRIASATIDTADNLIKVTSIQNSAVNAITPSRIETFEPSKEPPAPILVSSNDESPLVVTSVIFRNNSSPTSPNKKLNNDNVAPVDKYVQTPIDSFKQQLNSANHYKNSAIAFSPITPNKIAFNASPQYSKPPFETEKQPFQYNHNLHNVPYAIQNTEFSEKYTINLATLKIPSDTSCLSSSDVEGRGQTPGVVFSTDLAKQLNSLQPTKLVNLDVHSAGKKQTLALCGPLETQTSGRYVCPYCQLNCKKPSVLEKHIRAHTNERPYPCVPCGSAFKTRSNLYKHFRSRAHVLRLQGEDPQIEDETSNSSDPEISSNGSDVVGNTVSPMDDQPNSPVQATEKPYKPKFHNASLYTKDDIQKPPTIQQNSYGAASSTSISHPLTTQNVEYLKEHISKIISQNEAIMEVVEPALQKKYHKITGISRGLVINENSSSKLAMAVIKQREESNKISCTIPPYTNSQRILPTLQQQAQQVLETQGYHALALANLEEKEDLNKRYMNDTFTSQDIATHPQNPERSIIKDLLLNSRKAAAALNESEEQVHMCALCKITFRNADNLKYHAKCYCQGNQGESPQSAPISPVGSPSHKYFRSHSINVNLPEKYNPNTLAKLASSTLKNPHYSPMTLAKLAQTQIGYRRQRPENIVINTDSSYLVGSTSNSTPDTIQNAQLSSKLIDTPLPSPGPLLGKTRLVDAYNSDKKVDTAVVLHIPISDDQIYPKDDSFKDDKNYNTKRPRFDSFSQNSPLDFATTSKPLQMCGGEIKIVEKKEETIPRFGSSGGSIISISPSPDLGSDGSIRIRTGLHSGGSAIEITSIDSQPSSSNRLTPKKPFSAMPLPMEEHGSSSSSTIQRNRIFQFPAINSITDFNPLTLPPLSGNSIQTSTILHNGKLIPFVPGIPGPNSLVSRPELPFNCQNIVLNPTMLMVPPIRGSAGCSNKISPVGYNMPSINYVSDLMMIKNTAREEGFNKKPNQYEEDTSQTPNSKFITKLDCRKIVNTKKMSFHPNFSDPPKTTESLYFNFDSVAQPDIPKTLEIKTPTIKPLHIEVTFSSNVAMKKPCEPDVLQNVEQNSGRFLRPTSLPLKPGTFTPKKHHGITPTANTLPLISPETPRQSKNCVQLYLNGHAYTYLGLKCSTKTFYCTVNRPQPVHFTSQPKLSIYSNWQICAESNPHPMGWQPKTVMSLYDSRHRPTKYAVSKISPICKVLHSQSLIQTSMGNETYQTELDLNFQPIQNESDNSYTNDSTNVQVSIKDRNDTVVAATTVPGGYESNEDYTYVRGRGRGRYVCSRCEIRCKKPSMLKKHLRTHTDLRPYTCKYCSFSFKTKGNLTKHMKSKTHYKKCIDRGISSAGDDDCVDDDGGDELMSSGDRTISVDSDSDDMSDDDADNDSDYMKSRLHEHEAAKCLLSLSRLPAHNNMAPSLIPRRPLTYPYSDQSMLNIASSVQTPSKYASDDGSNVEIGVEHYYSTQKYSHEISPSYGFEDSNMPIDLRKPKDNIKTFDETDSSQVQRSTNFNSTSNKSHFSDVVTVFTGPASLLTSLVSITDKVPLSLNANTNVDNNGLFQTYLTERALLDSKMKQSQMHQLYPNSDPDLPTSTPNNDNMALCNMVSETFSVQDSLKQTIISAEVLQKNETIEPAANTVVNNQTFNLLNMGIGKENKEQIKCGESSHTTSMTQKNCNFKQDTSVTFSATTQMHTISNILPTEARSSEMINNSTPLTSLTNTQIDDMKSQSSSSNAKSVASEYLKMTSAEYMKNHSKSDRECSEESDTDEEINVQYDYKLPSELTGGFTRTVVVGEDGFKSSTSELPITHARGLIQEDRRSVCGICSKTFPKKHQMILHMNIHYMERKFRCEVCSVSFRTQGHLQKHERSEAHKNKILMTSTFGVATTTNPRPFECADCKIAFRIHGHLAKHLRSKTHVQKLECLQKLPFGTYAEIERAGISLTDIDTSDCDNSLTSLKLLAQKLLEKDSRKLSKFQSEMSVSNSYATESNSDEGEPIGSPDASSGTDEQSICTTESYSSVFVDNENVSLKRKISESSSNIMGNATNVDCQEKRLRSLSDT